MQFQSYKIADLIPASYNPRKKLKPGDKEYEKIVSIMSPLLTDIVAVPAPGTRGLPAADLKAVWEREKDMPAESADSVEKGLKKAITKCESGDAIVMFGSLSLLGELRWKN